jgi:hypothetical protein
MNVMFTSYRFGLCSASAQTETKINITLATAGTIFYFTNSTSVQPQFVPCIFVAEEFPVVITVKKKCARLNEAMGFASRTARNRLRANDSYRTKNWKGSVL